MTHEKLKTALREAFDDVHMIHSPKFLEFLAGALARRNVIVATAADSHISSKEVWGSWRDKAAVVLARAGVHNSALHEVANEIMHLLFPTPVEEKPPAPIFEVGKKYLSRCGEVWVITGTSCVPGYVFSAKRAGLDEGPLSFMANGNHWNDGRTHPDDLIPGALSDEPAPLFEAGKTYKMVESTINGKLVTGRTFRVDEVIQNGLVAKGALNGEEGWTYTISGFIPGAIHESPVLTPVSEVEPPADGSNWQSTYRPQPQPATPLTYEQACALPVGSEVVCLDVGNYLSTLTKGAVYKIVKKPFGLPVIYGKLGLIFSIGSNDCRLFAAVPSPQAAAVESTAPGVTDEEIGREMVRIYNDDIYFGRGTAKAHYAQMGRRARELLVPEGAALAANQCHDGYGDEWGNHQCKIVDDWKARAENTDAIAKQFFAAKIDAERRAEKAEAALERVRATFEDWLRPAATTEDGKHADTVLWEVAREAGLRIIPAEPTKPIRVEVAK
jgi:hypothetical protein